MEMRRSWHRHPEPAGEGSRRPPAASLPEDTTDLLLGRRRRVVLLVLALGAGLGFALAVSGPAAFGQDLATSFTEERRRMVDEQIRQRGIRDERILSAMEAVPRHLFVSRDKRRDAYGDKPLEISHNQTMSQPYVVALMVSLLEPDSQDLVLEIGTGSAYDAAVLSHLAREVYTIEIIPELAERAAETLRSLGYDNVKVRVGDGYGGWPEAAPFDAILLTAAPPEIPQPLIDQLAVGGKLVAPVGQGFQQIQVITKTPEGLEIRRGEPVIFAPMTGEVQQHGTPRP